VRKSDPEEGRNERVRYSSLRGASDPYTQKTKSGRWYGGRVRHQTYHEEGRERR
jgi:hypothetical protein